MFVDVGTARLFFDVLGPQLSLGAHDMEGRPTLLVLHGGPGSDHSGLRPYFDRFADTCQVIYLDHRGNGRSSGEPETWTLRQWGQDVRAVCERLGIERPIVYGNSFGGMVAISYAAQFPDHPAALILSSTAARLRLDVTYDVMEARGGARARDLAERLFSHAEEDVMAEYRAVCLPLYNPRPDPADGAIGARAILRGDVARHFFLGEMRTMDLRQGLAAIRCPTLVLAGAHDPITPVVCSEEIAAHLPPGLATSEVFEDAGHGVHRDDPSGAETAIRAFLARL